MRQKKLSGAHEKLSILQERFCNEEEVLYLGKKNKIDKLSGVTKSNVFKGSKRPQYIFVPL